MEQNKTAFRFIGKIDPAWISKLRDYDPSKIGMTMAADDEPGATIYAVILTDEAEDDAGDHAMDDFNPSEPRKPGGEHGGGEWTSGSGGEAS